MKKSIIKMMSLILTVLTVMSLSLPTFAAGTHAKPKAEPLTPTEDTTLGDVCRHFDPESFSALPANVQSLYNKLLLKDAVTGEEPEVYFSSDSDRVTVGRARISVNANGAVEAVTYSSALKISLECPAMVLTSVVYDAETNEIVDSDSEYAENDVGTSMSGVCNNLEGDHKYRVEAIAVVTPPAGCTIDGILHDSDTVRTLS